MSFCVTYLLRERKDTVSFRAWRTLLTGRGQSSEDAPIAMNELTHRDKTVLRQLFGAVGFFNGVLGDVRQNPVDHKFLGRVIEDVANHVQAVEKELDKFAKEWGYE